MEATRLVLKNQKGEVIRSFRWNGEDAKVIFLKDARRLDLTVDPNELIQSGTEFEELHNLNRESLPLKIGALGQLDWLQGEEVLAQDVPEKKERERLWWGILLLLFLFEVAFILYSFTVPPAPPAPEVVEEQVVKIEKQPEKLVEKKAEPVEPTVKKKPVKSLKRMGALAALGSLSKSNQRGGLDMGAVQTTAGPGLGGTGGSGGMQTNIYAKGLVAAPLGAGARADGGGGYGTKGRGGGQAGYGTMSLVGAAGTESIPLAAEATVDGGLDRDMIAEVIERNSGQVRFCYEQALQGDTTLAGRVTVDFVIGGNGTVRTASIKATTLNSKQVEDCVLMRLKSWKFPLPQGGVDVRVAYPFLLKRVGRG